jgi:hypothetical protein
MANMGSSVTIGIEADFINNISMIETLEKTFSGPQISLTGAFRARRPVPIRQKRGCTAGQYPSRSQTEDMRQCVIMI